jgi:hypothetical protein
MKNLIFLCALVFVLSSCSNVVFVSPQPEYIDALTEIPEKYHGIYEFEDSTINTDSYLVTDSSVGDMVLGDNLIVKQIGNYFFLNFFEENEYLVYVVKIIQILDYEDIEMSFLNITDENAYLFNILNLEEIKTFDDKDQFMFKSRPDYLLNDVSVNQLNLLINSSEEKARLLRVD